MDLERARYLVSEQGRADLASLADVPPEPDVNRLSTALRARFSPSHAAALGEQLALRATAARRFTEHSELLLTADGLEMMTHPVVANRRAGRLLALDRPVVDLTCGLGGDLAPCAGAAHGALGLERDAATVLLAAANVPSASIVHGDAERSPFDLAHSAVIIDPSRRAASNRRFDPAAFSPNWDAALALLKLAETGVLKTSPGIEHHHIPDWAEAEFVQLGRSMREAAIWAGAGATPGLRRAVLLPAAITLDSRDPDVAPEPVAADALLFDPESCVTRAGLVRQLAATLHARLLDPQVAYLTAPTLSFHPMAATFEVLDALPFSIARLKRRLREQRWRPHEIRRRAFPIEPDEMRKLLGPIPGDPVTVILTTIGGERRVFVARRIYPA